MANCIVNNAYCPTNMQSCTTYEYGNAEMHGTAYYPNDQTIARGEPLTDQQLINMQQQSISESYRRAQIPTNATAELANPKEMLEKVRQNLINLGIIPRSISNSETITVDDATIMYDALRQSGSNCNCNARCTCNNRSALGLNDTTCGSRTICGTRCSCNTYTYTSCQCKARHKYVVGDGCAGKVHTCYCIGRSTTTNIFDVEKGCTCYGRCNCNARTASTCSCNVRCPCDSRQ